MYLKKRTQPLRYKLLLAVELWNLPWTLVFLSWSLKGTVQVINAISSSKANLSQLGQVFDHMQNLDLNPIKDEYAVLYCLLG